MNINTQVILILFGAAVLLSAAVLLAVLVFFSFAQTRKDRKEAAFKHINNIYEKIIRFQTEHPEVLSLSRKWNTGMICRVYEQASAEDKQWAIYYTFVELCIGYCNAVLHARKRKLIDKDSYINQHEPFVKLLLRKHHPIIDDMVRERKYISHNIIDFRQNLKEKEGWDWEKEYKDMIKM
ncbi:MAG: hypothetical protein KAT34_02215 [Candidatus Aminicenantes bacterium]|nr:hypothetical protein [Candidatus Aminicenantes bacterium]